MPPVIFVDEEELRSFHVNFLLNDARHLCANDAGQVIQQYLRECLRYDSIYQNAKYTVMEMLTKRRHPDHLKVCVFVHILDVF